LASLDLLYVKGDNEMQRRAWLIIDEE